MLMVASAAPKWRFLSPEAMPTRLSFLLQILALLTAMMAPARAGFYPPLDPTQATRTVTVYSSLDETIAQPLINAFRESHRLVGIDYHELLTQEIYERIVEESDTGHPTADLAFSSAMDLQVKLGNDGLAQPLDLVEAAPLPAWARWRDTVFGVTFEPAVIIYNKAAFTDREPPKSHGALTAFLTDNETEAYGRVGTYDVERAGLGLFFLARDREHNSDIWKLFSALGAAGVKLYSNSSAIVERVADGRFMLGYNILGSYAAAWARTAPDLGIIFPEDYTVVMTRTALVPKAATAPDLGAAFLDFMLSPAGQKVLAEKVGLPALNPRVDGENTASRMHKVYGDRLRPIPVGPALVVYLDQVKRQRLIERWNEALRLQ